MTATTDCVGIRLFTCGEDMDNNRHYSFFDRVCLGLDQTVRALTNQPQTSGKPFPGAGIEEQQLSKEQRQHVAGLMRVNHAGEICAQALYHGQGMVSKSPYIQEKMRHAAIEEGDHLAWCKQRLDELDSHTSYLSPLWYAGSFCIGMMAGLIGDGWSLGFVAETERQVIHHLQGHLQLLPAEDARSYHVLRQMEEDEGRHRDEAIASGAAELPPVAKKVMTMTAKIMVKTAYYW